MSYTECFREKIEKIVAKLHWLEITRDEAEEMAKPFLDKMNAASEAMQEKYNKKFKILTLNDFMGKKR